MSHYPLSLQSFVLDFTFSQDINIENRFFISLPYINTRIEDNNKESVSLLSLAFEMNSQYKYDSGNMAYILQTYLYEEDNTYKDIIEHLKEDEPNINYLKDYYNEENLFSSLIENVKDFLVQHIDLHMKTFKKKNDISTYKSSDDDIIAKELIRVTRFTKEIIENLEFMSNNKFILPNNTSGSEKEYKAFNELNNYWNYLSLSEKLNINDKNLKKQKI